MALVFVPVIALLALLASSALAAIRDLRAGERPGPSELAWLAVPAAALVLAATWCARGLYTGGPGELVAYALAALVAYATALLRWRIVGALRRRLGSHRAEALLAVVALLACCALAVLSLEVPYSDPAQTPEARFFAIEALVVLGALTFLYFLFQRRGIGIALGVGLCSLTGVAQFFLVSFKQAAILPGDLYALRTAVSVSGGYVYAVDGRVALGLACALLAVAASALVIPSPTREGLPCGRRALANLAAAALVGVALGCGLCLPSYADDLGVVVDYWFTLDYYRRQGFFTTFTAIAQRMAIEVPEGYTDEGAAELESAYAAEYDASLGASISRYEATTQFEGEKPSIVCIMNETFSDLSIYDGASWGYSGPSYIGSMDDAVARGSLAVSVLGGGTCNSEFEFLTGVPLAYVGDGKYPYALYDLSEAPSLPKQLSALGYDTTAIHPNEATNWNRDEVYQALGFDRFLSIEEFEGAPVFHSGVTDAATYDKVLEVLEGSEGPQFVFDVTMASHSGYDQNNIPADQLTNYAVEGLGDYDNAQVSEYLACIDASDRELEEFLGRLRDLDRPVVVVFFGDHQPYLSTALNGTLFPDEGETSLEHTLRPRQTTYFIWANYDVSGSSQTSSRDDSSVPYLAAQMLDEIGAPLTDFQKAQLVARRKMPALSLVGACDADRTWVSLSDRESLPAPFDDLARITYFEFARTLT